MPEVGMDGQRRLKAGSVLCIGAGGLGSPAAMYLAAAGVGTIGLVDFDVVDFSNLQRQIIHGTPDVGRSKLASAKRSPARDQPARRDSDLRDGAVVGERAEAVRAVTTSFSTAPTTFRRGISPTTRACCSASRTRTAASSGSKGRRRSSPRRTVPCYRCLYPEPPPPGLVPSCAEGGVLGVLPGVIGVIQATEAIKLITGHRRAADRPFPDLRRAEDAFPRAEAARRIRTARCAARIRR